MISYSSPSLGIFGVLFVEYFLPPERLCESPPHGLHNRCTPFSTIAAHTPEVPAAQAPTLLCCWVSRACGGGVAACGASLRPPLHPSAPNNGPTTAKSSREKGRGLS